MPTAQGIDRERAAQELRPIEARRSCEQEPAEESVEVAHGDAEVGDLDAGWQRHGGWDFRGSASA